MSGDLSPLLVSLDFEPELECGGLINAEVKCPHREHAVWVAKIMCPRCRVPSPTELFGQGCANDTKRALLQEARRGFRCVACGTRAGLDWLVLKNIDQRRKTP